MSLILPRFGFGEKSTLGRFVLDGTPLCHTIEDARRAAKIPGKTCVPEGVYELMLYRSPRFSEKYEKLFPEIFKGMIGLKNVPGFEGVAIHCGNDEDDTEGCICVGSAPLVLKSSEFYIQNSQLTFRSVYPKIAQPLLAGVRMTIDIRAVIGPDLRAA